MPDIGNYTETTGLVLGEAGKYFALLLFSVLAIRLWRRWAGSSAANKSENLFLACAFTLMARGHRIFFHVPKPRQTLLPLRNERLPRGPAAAGASRCLKLSSKYWNSADALGQKGVCLLLSGDAGPGIALD